ncbi:zinc-binding protein A33-like [Python bivittatus]|uniref:Zinc-binding protein A33-like n=1 Tax=Python bivittatus TaxID=176946 RepID=A0A9F2R321_PYTBI|nr:zinc-binding protein A33-like [Python bivittatus]XP_025026424.1 zinc-binding protein A33-like [Python bivittatus]
MAGKSQQQTLQEELTCSICYDLFRNPVMLECMHHFCKECIQKYWNSCSGTATCPQCRQKFPSRSFHPNFLVSNVVETVRKSVSEQHRRKSQMDLQKLLQSYQMKYEKLLKMKRVTEEKIWNLVETSGKLNSEIRAAFQHLHQILEEEERRVLMELAREEEQCLLRLEKTSVQLIEEISELKKNMGQIQQKLNNLGCSSVLKVETVAVRPAVHLATLTLDLKQHKELQDGPLQYIFWRKMLKSISPAPTALTLDPESAHPNLILSKDLTSVTERETPQRVPRSPRRFVQSVNVLATESFESGRHYWEVWVGNKTKWELGVAADNVDRTARVRLCPDNGYWTIRLWSNAQYWAAATPWVRLKPQHLLRKVGVLLDCKAKTVTFYDAEEMSLLFTFHQLWASRFYPFFSTGFSHGEKNAEPMRICHPLRL